MTIRKITNLTSGLVTLADLRTPTTFVHKATVTRPTIRAADVTQSAIIKSTISTKQLVAAARFVNRLVFREADAFALLDLIGLTVGKPASDSFALLDVVSLLSARGAQRAFDDVELIDDFIAFVLHINRNFDDFVAVQQYVNLAVNKSAGNEIVRPADIRHLDLILSKFDRVTESDVKALLVTKPIDNSIVSADALFLTNRKLLRDSAILDSRTALAAGLGVFNTTTITANNQIAVTKIKTDAVAISQTQALRITKPAVDNSTVDDNKILKATLGRRDSVTVVENRLGFFIGKGLGDTQGLTDLFGVFDGLIFALSFQVFNAVATSDNFARTWTAYRQYYDTVGSIDLAIPQLGRGYRDNVIISDAPSSNFGKTAADSIAETDQAIRNIVVGKFDAVAETDFKVFSITSTRTDAIVNDDRTTRAIEKLLVDDSALVDVIGKAFATTATNNFIGVDDGRYWSFVGYKFDAAATADRRAFDFQKSRTELISSILPITPTAPALASLSSYATLLQSTLAITALNKVEIGTASIYNTNEVSGGRLLFTGYPGFRYVQFAPVSSYQADGANWQYGLDVEFYSADGSNGLEPADIGEDLVLQYSVDGGVNYTTAQTLWAGGDSWASVGSSLVVSTSVSVPQSTGLIWRIIQFNYSNPNFDQYVVVRANVTNWGAAATTIKLTDLVAIYDFARAQPSDRQVYIYDNVLVINLRPRAAADSINTNDAKSIAGVKSSIDNFALSDYLASSSRYFRTQDDTNNPVLITEAPSIRPGKALFDSFGFSDSTIYLRGLPRTDSFTVSDTFTDIVRAFRVFPEGVLAIDRPLDTFFKLAKQGRGVTNTVVGWGRTISQPPDTAGDFVVIGDPTTFATTTALPSRRSGTSLENFSFQYFKPGDGLAGAAVIVGGTSGFKSTTATSAETTKFSVVKNLPRTITVDAPLGSLYTTGNVSLSNSDNLTVLSDLTIEAYLYVQSFNGSAINLAVFGNAAPNQYTFGVNSSGKMFMSVFGETPITFGGTVVTGAWYHLAFTRLGDVVTAWMNGYNQGSTYVVETVGNTQGIKILETAANVYASQYRFIDGLALYQDNFVPPNGTLQNLTGTKVLLPTFDSASLTTNYAAGLPLTVTGSFTFSADTPYVVNKGTTEFVTIGGASRRRTSGTTLEQTVFNYSLTAKAGSNYTIFTETQDGALDTFSSLSVVITAADRDRVGIIDAVNANFYVDRGAADTLVIGSRIPFRTPSTLERISFLVTKYFGDATTMLDLANVFDGLVYVDTKLIRDTLVIGLPDTTRVSGSDQERTSFTVNKPARQGANLKVVSGWGANVVGTTSSGDFVVIGDPSIFATTTTLPTRRSGTSLENFSFQYFKPADGLLGTSVTVGSSLGDRLLGTNRETVKFTVVQNKFETVQPYDLNSIFKVITMPAKAGSAYTITRKTIEGTANAQSSVAVGIGAQQPDQLGLYDEYVSEFATIRTTSDSVVIGYSIPFRTPNNIERISFLITKFFGDQTPMLDLVGVFDGLVYAAFLLERDTQIIGSGALAADNRFLGSSENTAFDVRKSARQGAILKVVQGWGSSVTGTTSSGDFIVAGDPTALPTTNAAPSRRSGASLENISFQYFKPADGLIGTSVTVGSSLGDRLTGANKENVRFTFNKLANTEYGPDTIQPYDLNSIFKQVNFVAKAGSAYSITRKTIDGVAGAQSSVTVGIGAQQPDQLGLYDEYISEFATQRTTSDSVVIGYSIPFRTPNNIERISFLVTKFLGYDGVVPDDFLQTFDGLTYAAFLLERDAQIIGSGATAANNRFLGNSENVAFNITKSARQGAASKVVAGWNTNVVGTTSSGDFVVIGDPSTIATGQSRRSGASLENLSYRLEYNTTGDRITVPLGSGGSSGLTGTITAKYYFNGRFFGPAGGAGAGGIPGSQGGAGGGGGVNNLGRGGDGLAVISYGDTQIVFFTTGTTTWFVPENVSSISLEAIGAGGGGRYISGSNIKGGGGGAYAATANIPVTANQAIYIRVGQGLAQDNNQFPPNHSWINVNQNSQPTSSSDGVLAWGGNTGGLTSIAPAGGAAASSIGVITYSGGDGSFSGGATGFAGGGGAAGPDGAGAAGFGGAANAGGGGGANGGTAATSSVGGANGGISVPGIVATHQAVMFDSKAFNVAQRKSDTIQPYDLNSIFKQVNIVAKAGSAYTITRKTIEGLPDFQSSVAVGIGAQQPDQTGVFDAYLAELYTSRTTSDSVVIGYSIPFRTPNNIERISFLVTKFFGDDRAIPDDFLQTFDGLTYAAFLLERDVQTIGSGALAANNRFLGSSENTAFDFTKSARQGAALKVVTGWGSSIATTSSSSDRIVIGDPTALPTTNTAPSRRSGASLENISYTVGLNRNDGEASSISYIYGRAGFASPFSTYADFVPLYYYNGTYYGPSGGGPAQNSPVGNGGSSGGGLGLGLAVIIIDNQPIVFSTSGLSTWVVPVDVSSISVATYGAGAAGSYSSFLNTGTGGGGGAYAATSSIAVSTNQTLYIYVGGSSGTSSWVNLTTNAVPTNTSEGVLAAGASGTTGGQTSNSIGVVSFNGGNGITSGSQYNSGGGAAGPDGPGGASSFGYGGGANGGATGAAGGWNGPIYVERYGVKLLDTDRLTVAQLKTETVQPYDLNSIFKAITLDAKAGTSYSVTVKTFENSLTQISSGTIVVPARGRDIVGSVDFYEGLIFVARGPTDSVIIGSGQDSRRDLLGRERISFAITKFLGYDGVVPDDFLQTFDGLTYADVKLLRDSQIIGSGATAANNRFLGSNENTAFDVFKTAKQATNLKVVTGWNTSVVGTTSSGDFVVIGDPSTIASGQSRRSGTSLENFSFQYFKPADGLVGTSVTITDTVTDVRTMRRLFEDQQDMLEYLFRDTTKTADQDSFTVNDIFALEKLLTEAPADTPGDLDPFGNINTLISRGTLRITNYVEDIDYFESDYIGESRTIS